MEGTITMPDGTAIAITGVSLSEVDGVQHGSGFISTTAGGYLREHSRETGSLTTADHRQAAVNIDNVHTSTGGRRPAITTIRFYLPEGWA